MHHWSTINTIYIYDGTIDGLFTIVYRCFKEKTIPSHIVIKEKYVGNLFDQPLIIQTNTMQVDHVTKQISSKLAKAIQYHIYTAFLSGDSNKAKVIVEYIIHAFKYGKSINFQKSVDCVIEIQRMCRNVTGEGHRMLGFLRFIELKNHILYAKYESDNDILEYLASHFKKRLSNEIWMIHDVKRKQVALYNRNNYIIVEASNLAVSSIEQNQEDEYLILWKSYFEKIAIKERENKRCQRQFMPKKYWQYLPEIKEK